MTGLNLETFLYLLRADWAAWASLGVVVLVLALLTWTSWGSRRALRKCLVLSICVHVGCLLYGSTVPFVWRLVRLSERADSRPHVREIRVTPWTDEGKGGVRKTALQGDGSRGASPWDRPSDLRPPADPALAPPRPAAASPELGMSNRPEPRPSLTGPLTAPEAAAAAVSARDPTVPTPERREMTAVVPSQIAPGDPQEIPEVVAEPVSPEGRVESDASFTDEPRRDAAAPAEPRVGPAPLRNAAAGETRPALPRIVPREADLRHFARPDPGRVLELSAGPGAPHRSVPSVPPIALARVTPADRSRPPEIPATVGTRPGRDVPEVYRSRLDPNRSARAQRSGASVASEQAVERALDWLARHQDADGRWDAATARRNDGTALKDDDDFTVHCPPGETCFGESLYWESDTALTGLALLAYLGAGYTQLDGKYAEAVGKGLEFLLREQKSDGDLRGKSRAVGMYCQAMATLALCEAYALTGDERLRGPVERAVRFILRARARDGLAWRYSPGASQGDTSILGWVVLALKSATIIGIPIPGSVLKGVHDWLDLVASGPERGLARYQPQDAVTPTMTAEAWVCRQFLGFGGPGPASSEAAESLLENDSDRGTANYYYWYYGTLSMYQHGGEAWFRWNRRIRDQIVGLQRIHGHQAGSWDPDDSKYGAAGGRIYCTTLAALTLEVYYRFLRLYEAPHIAPSLEKPANRPSEVRPER